MIFGRKKEIQFVNDILNSNESEFFALYGRRRVGKTHLVRECAKNQGVYFEVVGKKRGTMKKQLEVFTESLSKVFFNDAPIKIPDDWNAAFKLLTEQIKKIPASETVVIFLDELPWLSTKRSSLLENLDHYWNTEWSLINNLKVIVCGSAASWMLENLINDKGGLHNRLTRTLLLKPFNLKDTKAFLEQQGKQLTEKHVLDLFMVTGGVAFYLKQYNKSKSITQNINMLCFEEGGLLLSEFTKLFRALFDESDMNMLLIREIAKRHSGLSRVDLIKKTGLKSGGTLNKRLEELISAGFVQSFIPYQGSSNEHYYRVIDEYSLFYLKWIDPVVSQGQLFTKSYWQTKINTPEWNSWAGYAFENVCMKHIEEIRSALDLSHTGCIVSNWRFIPEAISTTDGAQIDLLFDRDDSAITLCEIKYSKKEYEINKTMAKNLIKKNDVFTQQTKTKKQIFLAMITSMGLKNGVWADELVDGSVTLKDLFE